MREVSPFHTGRLAPPFSIGPVDFSESNLQYSTPPHLEHCLYASDCWWRHQSWRAVFSLIVRDVLFQSHDASPRAWTHAPSNLRMMCRLSTCPKNRFKKKRFEAIVWLKWQLLTFRYEFHSPSLSLFSILFLRASRRSCSHFEISSFLSCWIAFRNFSERDILSSLAVVKASS